MKKRPILQRPCPFEAWGLTRWYFRRAVHYPLEHEGSTCVGVCKSLQLAHWRSPRDKTEECGIALGCPDNLLVSWNFGGPTAFLLMRNFQLPPTRMTTGSLPPCSCPGWAQWPGVTAQELSLSKWPRCAVEAGSSTHLMPSLATGSFAEFPKCGASAQACGTHGVIPSQDPSTPGAVSGASSVPQLAPC